VPADNTRVSYSRHVTVPNRQHDTPKTPKQPTTHRQASRIQASRALGLLGGERVDVPRSLRTCVLKLRPYLPICSTDDRIKDPADTRRGRPDPHFCRWRQERALQHRASSFPVLVGGSPARAFTCWAKPERTGLCPQKGERAGIIAAPNGDREKYPSHEDDPCCWLAQGISPCGVSLCVVSETPAQSHTVQVLKPAAPVCVPHHVSGRQPSMSCGFAANR